MENQSLQNKKILWVEDDAFLSDIVARKMSTVSAQLLHAADGAQTFKILENETPDLIVLDVLLPGMSGYEILEKIKQDEKIKNIPVIILSNFGQKSEVEKGLSLGAQKYLIKATLTLDEILLEMAKILA